MAATPKSMAAKKMIARYIALRLLIAAPIFGVAGAAIHRHDVQAKNLHDLTKMGGGTPMIVQIHDPCCQLCRRLMSNIRAALDDRDNIFFVLLMSLLGRASNFNRNTTFQM
ncbi:MAG: hypothetical protein V3U65_14000 [Granulosicoccaceae bacterium]